MANASGSPSVHWFGFEVGPLAMFFVNTDAWIYPFVYELAEPQWLWLNASLAAVNRSRTPWLFVWGHRAMYCFKTTDPECNSEAETLRYGFLGLEWGLEQLLHRYSVDLYLAGHTHHYEREWPSYNGTFLQRDYVNPRATVHIQSGIAGVRWSSAGSGAHVRAGRVLIGGSANPFSFTLLAGGRVRPLQRDAAGPQWCAVLLGIDWHYQMWGVASLLNAFPRMIRSYAAFYDPSYNVGYGRITLHNDSSLTWTQFFAINGSVLDSFTITSAAHSFT